MKTTTELDNGDACYLIRKGGAWYRPNSRGYTISAIQAGRYTLEDAEDITHPNGPTGHRDNMFYVKECDVVDDDLAEVMRLRAEAREAALQYLSDTGQLMDRITAMEADKAAAVEAMIEVTIRGVTYSSMSAAGKDLGVSQQTVSRSAKNGTLEFCGMGPRGAKKAGGAGKGLPRDVPCRINGRDYPTIAAAARDAGVSHSAVSQALDAGRKQIGKV